jgi:hypothetical protein
MVGGLHCLMGGGLYSVTALRENDQERVAASYCLIIAHRWIIAHRFILLDQSLLAALAFES